MAYVGYNESKKKCNEKYLAKFARPTIRMTEEEKKIIEKAAIYKGIIIFCLDNHRRFHLTGLLYL